MRECWYLGANPVFRASFYNMYESVQTIGHRVNNKDTRPISMFVVLIMSLFFDFEELFYLSPARIYLFKVSITNTRKRCKICSKLIVKTPKRRSGVFIVRPIIVNFLFLVISYVISHF